MSKITYGGVVLTWLNTVKRAGTLIQWKIFIFIFFSFAGYAGVIFVLTK